MAPARTRTVPAYFRHGGFDPAPDLAALRDSGDITLVTTPFGSSAHLVTRHEDIRRVLADATCFSSVLPTAGRSSTPSAKPGCLPRGNAALSAHARMCPAHVRVNVPNWCGLPGGRIARKRRSPNARYAA